MPVDRDGAQTSMPHLDVEVLVNIAQSPGKMQVFLLAKTDFQARADGKGNELSDRVSVPPDEG
jgi:hypothetical protein